MIIDGHSHVILPAQKHIQWMNEAGVEKTILFSTIVHPETAADFSGLRKEMQRLNAIISGDANAAVAARRKALKEQKETIDLYPT